VTDTLAALGEARIPWGAWHGDVQQSLPLPADWRHVMLAPADAPALSPMEIEDALEAPLGARPLSEVVHGKSTVAIAIDDLSRPVPASRLLEPLVDRLTGAGIRERDITVIVASGAHRRATPQDLACKIGGALLSRVNAIGHDPDGPLVDTGVALAGVPVRLNPAFCRADVRIGLGGVLPHPFAGFSGGGKIVVPGLAGLDVLVRTHKYALMGLRGGTTLEGNRFRGDMERAVSDIGLHWTVNVVTNSRREVAFVAAGDLVQAHRAAAAAATRLGTTRPPAGRLDAMVLNAYPKDTELLQIEAALVALRSGMASWLTPDAPVVLAGACSDGMGVHGLFGPDGRLFRVPSPRTFLAAHPLIVFSPNVSQDEAAKIFWSGYPFCRTWDGVLAQLRSRLPGHPRIGIVPCAPLQLAGPGVDPS
jgi:nickel-dependent lactate racemase